MVHLMFTFPSSPQAQLVEGPLWLDLVHAIIAVYRQRLSSLNQPETNPATPQPTVQLRKLQNRFRSFLTAEESFWNGLVSRLAKTYDLHEAQRALDILVKPPSSQTVSDDIEPSSTLAHGTASPPLAQRESKLMLVYKICLYLGDLARYREQYNESDGRPKAGETKHTKDWKPKKGRGGKRVAQSEVNPKERDYSRAAAWYQQARLMLPNVGKHVSNLNSSSNLIIGAPTRKRF